MESVFTLDNMVTLGLLTLLQAVLGFDNLLYISIDQARTCRKTGHRPPIGHRHCCHSPYHPFVCAYEGHLLFPESDF